MSSVTAPSMPARRGSVAGRLGDPLVLGVFVGVFAGLVAFALLAVVLGRSAGPRPACTTEPICGPPEGPPRLVRGQVWRSPELGFELEYAPERWKVGSAMTTATSVSLDSTEDTAVLLIEGSRGRDARALFDRRLDALRGTYPDLHPNVAERTLLGPNIGYVDGDAIGGAYCGTNKTSGTRDDVLVMAATDGRLSVATSLVTDDCNASPSESAAFQHADSVLNTFRWRAGG